MIFKSQFRADFVTFTFSRPVRHHELRVDSKYFESQIQTFFFNKSISFFSWKFKDRNQILKTFSQVKITFPGCQWQNPEMKGLRTFFFFLKHSSY